MKDVRARSRRALVGQTRLCAHSRSGSPEAFDLSVPARRVGRGQDVSGAELGGAVAERVTAGVPLRVVAFCRPDGPEDLLANPAGGGRSVHAGLPGPAKPAAGR